MNGLLGTSAGISADLSLLLSAICWSIALFGAIQAWRKKFSKHCPIMPWAALLNWVPVLFVMIPTTWSVLVGGWSGQSSLLPIIHGVLGGITQLLMTYTVIRMYWVKTLPPTKPLWLMRTTITLWTLAFMGGTVVYISLYLG